MKAHSVWKADENDPMEYERREYLVPTATGLARGVSYFRREYEDVMRDFELITGLDRQWYGSPLGERVLKKRRKVFQGKL